MVGAWLLPLWGRQLARRPSRSQTRNRPLNRLQRHLPRIRTISLSEISTGFIHPLHRKGCCDWRPYPLALATAAVCTPKPPGIVYSSTYPAFPGFTPPSPARVPYAFRAYRTHLNYRRTCRPENSYLGEYVKVGNIWPSPSCSVLGEGPRRPLRTINWSPPKNRWKM